MERTTTAIPVLPIPRTRAMLVLWNPDATLQELTSVVTGDPSLTAQVIRAANSARSSPVEPVLTAHDAVVRLGLNGVRRLMSTAIADEQFRRIQHGPADPDELWRYSIATAVLAEVLAPGTEERAVAFTAGLLHDLGRLALLMESPSRFGVVVEAAQAGADALEVERSQFGVSHADAGREIAKAWRMPERLGGALGRHHEAEAHGLAWTVGVARLAALHAGYTDGVPSPDDPVTPEPALAALDAVGGPKGLGERIRWYRNASSAA